MFASKFVSLQQTSQLNRDLDLRIKVKPTKKRPVIVMGDQASTSLQNNYESQKVSQSPIMQEMTKKQ